MKFPLYQQLDALDCGPACLRMICAHHGRRFDLSYLRDVCSIGRDGVSLLGISDGAETIGMRSLAVKLPFKKFLNEAPLPCIAHWQQNHFVVVYKVTKRKVYVADPEIGYMVYTPQEFRDGWIGHGTPDDGEGVLLLLQTTPEFLTAEAPEEAERKSIFFYFTYLREHRRLLGQLFIGLSVGLVLDLIFPFLTQSVVDYGIGHQDLNFITIILIAQLMLTFSDTAIDMLRSWIMLHIGSRISISLISDFLNRLLKLPSSFFDSRTAGDIMQRIDDHERIRSFLTSSSLNAIFSIFTFIVFGAILAFYNTQVLVVYLVLSLLNVGWLALFMKRRRILDNKRFELGSKEQDRLVELVKGAQEIKLQGIEKQKRWGWEEVSAQEFRLSIKRLMLRQYQEWGSLTLGQTRNIIITFLVARAVVQGEMTLGMMLSTQYMIGRLGSPIRQLTQLLYSAQDAKLSLERMQEIYVQKQDDDYTVQKLHQFPPVRTLTLHHVTFRYPGAGQANVLQDVNMTIPEGRVTAVVGASGSGKTTLLRLLLNLYHPDEGDVYLSNVPLRNFDSRSWRQRCGVVMQDGFIFADTIAKNIACGDSRVDMSRLREALRIANLSEFIQTLPLGADTRIGDDGMGISGGQKQRILIARAVYKNPEYLFLDEATSSLDAKTEKAIVNNLAHFMQGRTVVVIAHRLSTVKHADQIVVLDRGRMVEAGTHNQLVSFHGAYYDLVRNQLELG